MSKRSAQTELPTQNKKPKRSDFAVKIDQYENGRLKIVCEYMNGKKHGLETHYSKFGVCETIRYRHGQRSGVHKTWDTRGRLIKTVGYLKGKLHGYETHYDNISNIINETAYNKGECVKRQKELDRDKFVTISRSSLRDKKAQETQSVIQETQLLPTQENIPTTNNSYADHWNKLMANKGVVDTIVWNKLMVNKGVTDIIGEKRAHLPDDFKPTKKLKISESLVNVPHIIMNPNALPRRLTISHFTNGRYIIV
jgi:hypothetical protein